MNRRFYLGLVFCLGAAGVSAAFSGISAEPGQALLQYLPAESEASGWKPSGEPRLFVGERLFEYLDGGAEVYREYGFRQALVQDYRHSSGRLIVLELYEMIDAPSAFGLFTFKSAASGRDVPIGQAAQLADYYLNAWQGRFVITASGDQEGVDIVLGVQALAKAVAAKIPAEGTAAAAQALFPEQGRVPSGFKFFKGPLALNNSYAFSAEDVFRTRRAFKADYAAGYSLYLFLYEDREQSRSRFLNVSGAFGRSDRFTGFEAPAANRFRVRDGQGRPVQVLAQESFILVCVGADDPAIADEAARSIEARMALGRAGDEAGRAGAESGRFKVGFAERLRYVTWDNAETLDQQAGGEKAFTLQRTSLTLDWRPTEDVELGARLVNESRFDIVPRDRSGFNWQEGIVDNLFVAWQRPLGLPLKLTVGRQDFVLGEGLLLADGTPLDETRSAYFNAVKLEWLLRPAQRLTAFYAYQPTQDRVFPVVHGQNQPLLEFPISVVGLDYTMSFGPNDHGEAYILSLSRNDRSLRVTTRTGVLGSRVVLYPWSPLAVTAEAAYEFGQALPSDSLMLAGGETGPVRRVHRAGFGGYLHADYRPKKNLPFPEALTLGGFYLSGDKAGTETREDWDPFFGRWPKWSESYIYTLKQERGLAWWSNMASIYASAKFLLTPRLRAGAAYHHLLAARNNRFLPAGSSSASGQAAESQGRTRGELFIFDLELTLSKNIFGHLIWETFSPGSFYVLAGGTGPGGRVVSGYDYLQFEFQCRF